MIDLHRKSVGPRHGEWALLENLHAHAAQHRQQLAQRGRTAAEVPGQKNLAALTWFQLQLYRVTLKRLDDGDVSDRLRRSDHLLELFRQRLGVVLGDGLVDHTRGTEQPVGPGTSRRGEQVLDPAAVHLGRIDGLAVR